MAKSGDKCEKCGRGRLVTENTIIRGDRRIRYLGCNQCGNRPNDNKVSLLLEYAPPRHRGD